MGDRILFVNGVDIRGASHQDAVLALLSKKDSMKMKVQHDPLPSGFRVSCLLRAKSTELIIQIVLCIYSHQLIFVLMTIYRK